MSNRKPKKAAAALPAVTLAQLIKKHHGVDRPRATFDALRDEILALSVFASAAYRASNEQRRQFGHVLAPDDILMGHDWHPLAAAAMRRIAEMADQTVFVDDALPEGGEEENALFSLSETLAPAAEVAAPPAAREAATPAASDGTPGYLERWMDSDVARGEEQLDPKRD